MSIHHKAIVLSLVAILGLTIAAGARVQSGRDYVYIVGSSTVYPFATVVAERFGRGSEFKTPKVESTGWGGGIKLFCGGGWHFESGSSLLGSAQTLWATTSSDVDMLNRSQHQQPRRSSVTCLRLAGAGGIN